MFKTISSAAIVALLSSTASADSITFARLSYDYTRLSQDNDLWISLLQGGVEYQTDQLLFGGDATATITDGDDDDRSSVQTYELWVGTDVTSEILLGGGLLGLGGDVQNSNGLELFGQYDADQFAFGVRVARRDLDEDNITTTVSAQVTPATPVTLGALLINNSEIDGVSYILSAEYAEGPVEGRAYYLGDTDDESSVFGLRGRYLVAQDVRLSASFNGTTGDEDADFRQFAVGAGYALAQDVWFDVDYGKLTDDNNADVDIDRIQATLTYTFGERRRIDNRLEQATTDDFVEFLGLAPRF